MKPLSLAFAALACVLAVGSSPIWAQTPSAVPFDGSAGDTAEGHPQTYMIDDDTAESSIGVLGGGHMIWLNQFEITATREFVSSISVAFGAIETHHYVKAFVWSDPDQDGDPSDALVLSTTGGFTASVASNTFTLFDTPDVYVGPAGTKFFAGIYIEHLDGRNPAQLDQSVSAEQSWFIAGGSQPLDPENLGDSNIVALIDSFGAGLAGNWLIRAGGVPGPGVVSLLVPVGLLAAARRRRHSQCDDAACAPGR